MDDDWDFSQEDLDALERNALRQLVERNSSSHTSSVSTSCNQQRQPAFSNSNSNHSPPRPFTGSSSYNKVGALSPTSRVLPASLAPRVLPASLAPKSNHDCSKELPKRSVKFFLHSSGNIAAKFSYDQILVDAFRKIPKASWNAKEKLWVFPISSLSSAEKVLNEISGYNVEVENLHHLVYQAFVTSSAAPDLRDRYDRIPHCIESKLLPFQRDGIRFVLQHGGRALLADEMGLGKTIQAIAVTTCVRDSWPVLVLAPSSLRLQWASMIQQWLNIPSSDILVVLPQSGGSNRAGFTIVASNSKGTIHLDGVFNIISYDVVPKLKNILEESEFKVVIADESHLLKNNNAKRTIASLPIIQNAKCAILLSGTPALSRPIELFTQLQALYPAVYRSVHEYGERYCKGGVFGKYQGASNHEELHNLMKATVMIRRLKKDVLSELPVKRRQQVFLNVADKDMKEINALFHQLEEIKCKIKASNSKEEADLLKFSEKNLINKIYNVSAEAKIPAVQEYLETVIEADCKFLIFAHHIPMIDSIHKFLLKKKVGCIRIDGSTPTSSRQALVTDFQEKDSIKAAVLSIKAAGVGLTLTAASTVIFAELSWTPGDIIQAEDRVHRIGQPSSVNIYYLLANDTVDDIIWDVVQNKLDNLGQMLDGQENTLEVSGSEQQPSAKQNTLDAFMKQQSPAHQNNLNAFMKQQPKGSPAKERVVKSSLGTQKTLDCFVKRCNNPADESEHVPKLKCPRH